jgi:hypothetical protein
LDRFRVKSVRLDNFLPLRPPSLAVHVLLDLLQARTVRLSVSCALQVVLDRVPMPIHAIFANQATSNRQQAHKFVNNALLVSILAAPGKSHVLAALLGSFHLLLVPMHARLALQAGSLVLDKVCALLVLLASFRASTAVSSAVPVPWDSMRSEAEIVRALSAIPVPIRATPDSPLVFLVILARLKALLVNDNVMDVKMADLRIKLDRLLARTVTLDIPVRKSDPLLRDLQSANRVQSVNTSLLLDKVSAFRVQKAHSATLLLLLRAPLAQPAFTILPQEASFALLALLVSIPLQDLLSVFLVLLGKSVDSIRARPVILVLLVISKEARVKARAVLAVLENTQVFKPNLNALVALPEPFQTPQDQLVA